MNATMNTVQLLWVHRKTGFIAIFGTIALGFGVFYLNSIHSEYATQKQQSDELVRNLNEQENLKARFENFQKNQIQNPAFALFQRHNLEGPIANKEAEHFFQKHRNALKIEKMKFSISPDTTEVVNGITLTKSKIQIDVKILSDYKFFQLVDRIYQSFPGIVSFQIINIHKNTIPTNVKSKERPHFFDGQIIFQWMRQKQKS